MARTFRVVAPPGAQGWLRLVYLGAVRIGHAAAAYADEEREALVWNANLGRLSAPIFIERCQTEREATYAVLYAWWALEDAAAEAS